MKHRGFSLIELLVVIAVLVILAVMSLPALSSLNRSWQLSRSTQALSDAFHLARTTALSRNADVAMRFYEDKEDGDAFRGFRFVLLREDGSEESLSRVTWLPEGLVLSPDAAQSSLLGSPPVTGTEDLPGRPGTDYTGFRFRPGGTTDLDPGQEWFVTLREKTAQQSPPANYATFLINPDNGVVRTYRP